MMSVCVGFFSLCRFQCRYTLQYTYPYAYYMESGPRKKLVRIRLVYLTHNIK